MEWCCMFTNWYKGYCLSQVHEVKPIEDCIFINLPKSRQQTSYSCGAVCLRSIAKYYDKDLEDEKDFIELCNSGKIKGTHPEDLVKAAIKLGLHAEMKEKMSLKDLFSLVKNKIPVIVAIQAWGKKNQYNKLQDGHYVITIGFDDNNVYFEDPSSDKVRRHIPIEEFYKRWVDQESYVDFPIKERLGVAIYSEKPPVNVQLISDSKEMP